MMKTKKNKKVAIKDLKPKKDPRGGAGTKVGNPIVRTNDVQDSGT